MSGFPGNASMASKFQKQHRHLFDLLSMIEQPAWCFHVLTGEVLVANPEAAAIAVLPSQSWFGIIAPNDLGLITGITDWSRLEKTLKLRLNVAKQVVHYTVRLRGCSPDEELNVSNTAIAIASRTRRDSTDQRMAESARFTLVDDLPLSVVHKDVEGRFIFANRRY